MGFFNVFRKKSVQQPQIETKSDTQIGNSFVGFLQDNDNYDLSFAALIEYSERCAPFCDAINMISDGVAEIKMFVRDKQTNELIDNHPILDLLQYPNNTMSGTDFMRHYAGMFGITGNPMVKTIGNVNNPPLSVDILNPSYTTIDPDRTGEPSRITVRSEFENAVYRGEDIEGRLRFRANEDNELWHTYTFNPQRGSRDFYGTPTAKPLYNDIEQYIQSGTHNKSLLKRGARPGGSFTSNKTLTDTQFKRMQDQIDLYYVGANNAGRPLLLENSDYKEHIVNNRDMDYKTLNENATIAIYRQYKIPIPLIQSSSMTYSNYETAQVALYDNAILPVTDFLYEQLTVALMYRFEKDWRRYELAYDKTAISALQLRQTESVKTKKQIGVHTVNELRSDFGDDPLVGGDVVLRPANEIPALEDEQPPTEGESKSFDESLQYLKNAVDSSGKKRFSDEQIETFVNGNK